MNSKKPAKLFPLVFPMLMDYSPSKIPLLRLANKSVLKEAVDTQLQKLSACPISEFGYIPSWKENVNNPQTKVEVMRNKFEFENRSNSKVSFNSQNLFSAVRKSISLWEPLHSTRTEWGG
ncbi:hypothetical protein Ocin01_19773 [Orchesella cincta]|uniref:Uncharacterized protein n=1 Tax=Orchesella cincta TaxID=48709 RepID=A0A1D2M1R6_ORCCI|nr:hypothetical protein Ocin01_19773 [Orchesella cincta]